MWELDYKERWALKNWCFQTVVLEKTPESPLDCKETKPFHPKGDQPWILSGKTDAEAEAPILWPPDAKSQLTGKDSDAGKDWRQEEKGVTEDELVGWYHWLNGREFEQSLGNCEGQRKKPGVLQTMGLQRVECDLVTEKQQLRSLEMVRTKRVTLAAQKSRHGSRAGLCGLSLVAKGLISCTVEVISASFFCS